MSVLPLVKFHGLGNDFLVALDTNEHLLLLKLEFAGLRILLRHDALRNHRLSGVSDFVVGSIRLDTGVSVVFARSLSISND